MNEILINIFSQDMDEKHFEKYSKEFIENNSMILNYLIPLEDLEPNSIIQALNFLIENQDIDMSSADITLQTNIVDYGFFNAVFFSEIIDQVRIIPSNTSYLAEVNKNFNFINEVVCAVKDELRIQKVQIHQLELFDLKYLLYVNKYKLYNFIAPAGLVVEHSTQEKNRYNLKFKTSAGMLETNFNWKGKKEIKVDLTVIDGSTLDASIIGSGYGISHLIILNSQLNISQSMKVELERLIIQRVQEIHCATEVHSYINEYVSSQNLNLTDFMNLNIFNMQLGFSDGLSTHYEYLLRNAEMLPIGKLHAAITNALFYESAFQQNRPSTLFKSRVELMKIINEKVPTVDFKIRFSNRKNKIAIVAGQLLSLNHAPTKWALDYANALKKYYPELQIKIFVEDFARYHSSDLDWRHQFVSGLSESCTVEHEEYLHKGIEVYYSDSALPREQRVKKDIQELLKFNPSIIYKSGSKYNMAVEKLYPYYPVISHTMGGAEDSECVDIFTGGYTPEQIKVFYDEQNYSNYNYIHHAVGIDNIQAIEKKNRKNYKLKEEDFVLVTVGNRLPSEVTEKFITQIINFLNQSPNGKWLIVGTDSLEVINQHCAPLLEDGKIIFVPYEKDLFDLYRICDVYVNPIRNTGGNSSATAMKAKLPIVTADPSSDVGVFAGADVCIDDDGFEEELKKLYEDKSYYEKFSNMMFNRIENEFSFKRVTQELMDMFTEAQRLFEERKEHS